MKISKSIIIILLSILIIGCGKDSYKQMNTKIYYKKKKIPSVVKHKDMSKYLVKTYRDPMVAVVGQNGKISSGTYSKSGRKSKTTSFISGLFLSGIITEEIDGEKRIYASLGDVSGNTYIIKDQKIINKEGNEVKGFKGVLKEDKVLIMKKNRLIKTLKMKK